MRRPLRSHLLPALCAGTFLGLSGGYAGAAEPAPPPPPDWWSTVTATGVIDAGVTFNPELPGDGLNFGQLYTDKANQPLLNGVLLTLQRPFDPKSTDYDFVFKFQFQYGSDARYNHYLGELNYIIDDRNQFAPVELWLGYHLPWLFSGGIDIKVGQFVTLLGAETIDPTTNYFNTKSYMYNFGIPFQDTGIMTIFHVDPLLDIYAGAITGVNTAIGYRGGDNNGAPAFEGGIGLNLLGGNLTVLAATNIGPELPDTFGFPGTNTVNTAGMCFCNPNTALRYLNDIVTTWKVNDAITLITDLNYIRDDGFKTTGYGVAQYVVWTVVDWLKVVGRAEVWRDNGISSDNGITHTGFFVAGFPGNFDFVNSEWGFLNTSFVEVPTTYFEVTAGLNITPPVPDGWSFIKGVILRPEVRYDTSLNGTTPFDGSGFGGRGFPGIPEFGLPAFGTGTKSYQVTFGGDVLIKF